MLDAGKPRQGDLVPDLYIRPYFIQGSAMPGTGLVTRIMRGKRAVKLEEA